MDRDFVFLITTTADKNKYNKPNARCTNTMCKLREKIK